MDCILPNRSGGDLSSIVPDFKMTNLSHITSINISLGPTGLSWYSNSYGWSYVSMGLNSIISANSEFNYSAAPQFMIMSDIVLTTTITTVNPYKNSDPDPSHTVKFYYIVSPYYESGGSFSGSAFGDSFVTPTYTGVMGNTFTSNIDRSMIYVHSSNLRLMPEVRLSDGNRDQSTTGAYRIGINVSLRGKLSLYKFTHGE